MKITLIQIGKTEDDYIIKGVGVYTKRLQHYVAFNTVTIPAIKASNLSIEKQKAEESTLISAKITATDFVILLDENGIEYSSKELAVYLQQLQLRSLKNVVFIIGGPFGFDKKLYERANAKISLSKMTFSHQMIRLLFTEQLYRAYTIIKGEKYHHE